MAGILKAGAVQLGDSATATQNFTLRTNIDGTATLARGNVGATTQDILTIDAAGVASLLGKLVFSRGNVLGPVSQAAGVPTGAVIERGSNVNGEYVRFADGTQICKRAYAPSALSVITATGGRFISSLQSMTFPAAFVGTIPSVSGGYVDAGTQLLDLLFRSTTLTGVDYYVSSLVSTTPTTGESWVAVGRWF